MVKYQRKQFPTSLLLCAALFPGVFTKTTTVNHSSRDVCWYFSFLLPWKTFLHITLDGWLVGRWSCHSPLGSVLGESEGCSVSFPSSSVTIWQCWRGGAALSSNTFCWLVSVCVQTCHILTEVLQHLDHRLRNPVAEQRGLQTITMQETIHHLHRGSVRRHLSVLSEAEDKEEPHPPWKACADQLPPIFTRPLELWEFPVPAQN